MNTLKLGHRGLSLVTVAVLAACGGGGAGDSPTPAATLLSGVAATGGALAGATVTVIDSDASTADKSVSTGTDGAYTVDVSGLKAPLLLKVNATVQGSALELVAVVPNLSLAASNTANITPLTNAVAALIAPGGDTSALASADALKALSVANLSNASTLLVNTLAGDPAIKAALGNGFDPLTTAFLANGSGIDGVLDKLDISVTGSSVSITNLAAPATDSGNAAAVTLTPAQAATPDKPPVLPPSSDSANLPGAADLAAIAAKFEACFALPLAQRVTMDTAGTVTSVAAACNFAAADWRSGGRNWVQNVGQFTFAKAYLSGAKVGKGQIALALPPANLTDPKTFKHPYCNTRPCAVVRFPYTTASGFTVNNDFLLAKIDSAWTLVGNQSPYNVYVEPRLIRYAEQNTSVPNGGNAYFYTPRVESQLRLNFALDWGDTHNIRAVRFTGPGLPTAGVVSIRSQGCGTADRMGLAYQSGSTRVFNSTASNNFQFWTGSVGTYFTLDAATLNGQPLTLPTPVMNASTGTLQNQSFSPLSLSNLPATIPAWSVFKVEVFHYDILSDTPDEVLYVRVNAAADNASSGVAVKWPTLDAAVVSDYLTPTGAKAGPVTDVVRSLSWTQPAGGYVGSGYIYGNDSATVTGSKSPTTRYFLQDTLSLDPAALGDTRATGYVFSDVAAGTSLSTYTQDLSSNPNPRCSVTGVPALVAVAPGTSSGTTGSYREIGLSFRSSDRKLYTAAWNWRN